MKFGILKDIDWAYVGALFSHEDDNKQAEFLKSFIKECQSWGTSYQVQMQLANVNDKLTEEEREVLSMLSYNEKEE